MSNEPHLAYQVELYDGNDATRWIVTRTQTGDGYLVQLDPINQHHKCGCLNGQFQKPWSKKYCKHIRLVLQEVMKQYDDILDNLL